MSLALKIKVSSSRISVLSSDYGVSSSCWPVGGSKDGVDSSVGDFYCGNNDLKR
jgi:hypothetical protein